MLNARATANLSLYPALHRLERQGLLASEWQVSENGQRVKVYRLTAEGTRQLVAERTRWEELTAAIRGVLSPPAGEGRS